MSNRVVIFSHQNPYPPKYGFLSRVLSMIQGFSELGYEVHLFGFENSFDNPWTAESVEYLKSHWVNEIHRYKISVRDYRIQKILKIFYKRIAHKKPPEFLKYRLFLDNRAWFSQEIEQLKPDVIMMNYAQFDGLLDHRRFHSLRRVIDTIDLRSLNVGMQENLNTLLPSKSIQLSEIDMRILQEDFFKTIEIKTNPQEYRILDQYTDTIAIAKSEADIIQNNTCKTRVTFIPMMQEPKLISNKYTGPAIFTMGPNPFNLQGYLYFACRVLPLVLEKIPDFELQVTGNIYKYDQYPEIPAMPLLGHVRELLPYYENSGFAISPVFGGTGQQIKIIEAMAYGLPVVALETAAERSPIVHGINSLVAHDANEFADHVCRLWLDRELCQKLGQAARQTIQESYSQEQLNSELAKLVSN